MTGARGTTSPGKLNLYTKVVADLVNGGKTTGFTSKDVGVQMGRARRVIEGLSHG